MKSKSKFDRLLIGTSAIAMAVASAIAVAQENAQKEAEAPSHRSGGFGCNHHRRHGHPRRARNRGRNQAHADTFVDSVTASDVTSLPDMSVAEALQRVPGVTVSRFPRRAVLRLTSRHRKAAAT